MYNKRSLHEFSVKKKIYSSLSQGTPIIRTTLPTVFKIRGCSLSDLLDIDQRCA